VIAEPVRLPPLVMPDRPIPAPRRLSPRMPEVVRIREALGVRPGAPLAAREPAREGYGPTSSFSEAMLFQAYRRTAVTDQEELP
jgi:hypothetical protein